MADWGRALEIVSGVGEYSGGDVNAQASMRVWRALQTKLLASAAVSGALRDRRVAEAEASVEALGMEQKKEAVMAVISHFEKLVDGRHAIQDALRPLPKHSVLWADPALHESIVRFLHSLDDISALGQEDCNLDWAAQFIHDPNVVDAKIALAAAAYENVKLSFERICAARETMQALEQMAR